MVCYVIDTSVVFEASIDVELRKKIRFTDINFIAPAKIELELANRRAEIKSRAGLNNSRFNGLWRQLCQKISIKKVDQSKVNQAERILRDLKNLGIGLEDKFFFAMALYLGCPYWTFESKYWANSTVSNALRARGIVVVATIPL